MTPQTKLPAKTSTKAVAYIMADLVYEDEMFELEALIDHTFCAIRRRYNERDAAARCESIRNNVLSVLWEEHQLMPGVLETVEDLLYMY